jgi:transcription elongation factor GreA
VNLPETVRYLAASGSRAVTAEVGYRGHVMTTDPGAPALFRAIGLPPDGPAVLGRPIRAPGPGVYVLELADPLPAAPIELTRVGKWIERVPGLRLDGERPTSRALASRLASFWLPSRRVLYVGAAETSVAARVAALEQHVLGDRRPHAAAHWLKTLRVDGLRVWWAATDAAEEYEDALLGAFAASVPAAEVAALPDATVVLPWANLRAATGEARRHGLTGQVPPAAPAPPAPPTRIVDVPPGDAEGARTEVRGTGTTRRAPAGPPATRAPRRPAAPTRAPEPLLVSAEGLERLRTEHAELVGRRPAVVARIRAAKELGDLKENSDYTAAREEQSFLEGRIQALEAQLRSAVVADAPTGDRVAVGSTVTVEIDGEERRFTIVGSAESNAAGGRISHRSPVGQALVGRAVGEEAVATTPGGELRVLVVAIDQA